MRKHRLRLSDVRRRGTGANEQLATLTVCLKFYMWFGLPIYFCGIRAPRVLLVSSHVYIYIYIFSTCTCVRLVLAASRLHLAQSVWLCTFLFDFRRIQRAYVYVCAAVQCSMARYGAECLKEYLPGLRHRLTSGNRRACAGRRRLRARTNRPLMAAICRGDGSCAASEP